MLNNTIEMTYNKDADIKYTDMCIYIGDHMKDLAADEPDDVIVETVYRYLYLVIYMLACKERYLPNINDYDDFAISTAGIIYMRISDKRQYLPDDDPKKIKPITNILDYLKNCLYGLKVNYQQQNYAQSFPPSALYDTSFEQDMKQSIQSDYYQGLDEAITDQIKNLPSIINNVIKNSPYKSDKLLMKNIYMSVLLSFVDSLTIPNNQIAKLEKKKNNRKEYGKAIAEIYKTQREGNPVLYHIDSSMSDYIKLSLNKVKKEFSKELLDTKSSFELTDDVLEDIMSSVYENNNRGDDYEEY